MCCARCRAVCRLGKGAVTQKAFTTKIIKQARVSAQQPHLQRERRRRDARGAPQRKHAAQPDIKRRQRRRDEPVHQPAAQNVVCQQRRRGLPAGRALAAAAGGGRVRRAVVGTQVAEQLRGEGSGEVDGDGGLGACKPDQRRAWEGAEGLLICCLPGL